MQDFALKTRRQVSPDNMVSFKQDNLGTWRIGRVKGMMQMPGGIQVAKVHAYVWNSAKRRVPDSRWTAAWIHQDTKKVQVLRNTPKPGSKLKPYIMLVQVKDLLNFHGNFPDSLHLVLTEEELKKLNITGEMDQVSLSGPFWCLTVSLHTSLCP